MNNFIASLVSAGSDTYIAAIAALCFFLILCCCITICVLDIRKQVREINRRLSKLIALIGIKENEKVIRKLVVNKQKLKLDDNDIEKLKSLGVGME